MKPYWNLSYVDPAAAFGTPHSKSWWFRKVLEQRYAFNSLYTYGFQTDDSTPDLVYDESHFHEKLESNELFPANCFILLDLEGLAWLPYDQYGRPKQKVIDARCEVCRKAKALRPDCKMGMYAYPPCSDPERVLYTNTQWQLLIEAMRPLVEIQDCIVPSFYLRRSIYSDNWLNMKQFTAQVAIKWVHATFNALQAMFPHTAVWPIVWPMYKDWPAWKEGAAEYGFTWTPSHVVWSHVDTEVWRALLSAISQRADTMLVWGQGHCPWNAAFEWFAAARSLITPTGVQPDET
jgi:hypothetical protein